MRQKPGSCCSGFGTRGALYTSSLGRESVGVVFSVAANGLGKAGLWRYNVEPKGPRYDSGMNVNPSQQEVLNSGTLVQTLADFRYQLRRFLAFSEQAAQRAGLAAQQHQLLLQVAGAAEGVLPTIAYVAARLSIRQNSAVELTDRCVEEGLVERTPDANDKRKVILRVTPRGRKTLQQLSGAHARELKELAPRLVSTLRKLSEYELPANGVRDKARRGEAHVTE